MARVCVFCGARMGRRPEFAQAARDLGNFLADNGHTMIYGGGSTGIMGVLADTMLQKHAPVIGVIPKHLATVDLMHHGVVDMRLTENMHERKALMHALTDLYVALPGGFGTMEELFEAITWAQLDLHARPIAILDVDGLYAGLSQLIDTMETEEFLSARCRNMMTVFNQIEDLFDWLPRHCVS
jgi:uncharacterized protein (TIGR00730 family)